MKYTLLVLMIACIGLFFVKDASGESYLVKIVSAPFSTAQKGNEVVNKTKDIMQNRDNQIKGYMEDPQPDQTQPVSDGGYGNKKQ